jgi:hypothetical protein
MLDSIALWIIVLQGFGICWFEYDVWRMNRDRFLERKQWRLAKQSQKLKKLSQETEIS